MPGLVVADAETLALRYTASRSLTCGNEASTCVTSDLDRVGRRRLAHPRPPAGAGRAAQLAFSDRPGAARRAALHGAHAQLVGVAELPHGGRPGGSRRVRHPRDGAGYAQAVPGDLQADQGAHVPRRPDRRAEEAGPARRAAPGPTS